MLPWNNHICNLIELIYYFEVYNNYFEVYNSTQSAVSSDLSTSQNNEIERGVLVAECDFSSCTPNYVFRRGLVVQALCQCGNESSGHLSSHHSSQVSD